VFIEVGIGGLYLA